jgi:hypothetical protein
LSHFLSPRIDSTGRKSPGKSSKKLSMSGNDNGPSHALLSYQQSSGDPSQQPSVSVPTNSTASLFYHSNDPRDYLIKFFIHYGIPFSAFKEFNLNQFIASLNPNFHLYGNKQEIIDLVTRNYNFIKSQELTLTKNADYYLTVVFHSEQNDINKFYSYYTSILSKNQNAYNIDAFQIENKNEIHLYSGKSDLFDY